MKRHKENSFTKKFDLFNTQEHNVDIRWSSSESSDYENVTKHIVHGPSALNNQKRKRKKKVKKNISNLSFIVVKVPKEDNNVHPDKSPIISRLYLETEQNKKSSPILSTIVNVGTAKKEVKSPVFLLKQKPSMLSQTIKKRLFVPNDDQSNKIEGANILISEELEQSSSCKNKITTKAIKSISHNNNLAISPYANTISYSTEIPLKECDDIINSNTINNSKLLSANNNPEKSFDVSKPRTKIDLVKKVQSYFDSQFGSDGASQQSISETETLTPKSDAKFEDLEITNSLSQNKVNSPLPVQESSSIVSHGSWEVKTNAEKSKKAKYKKDGLAYRLEQLLKKQNANISLWQHEKFLAKNSKFIIPKSEHIVFRIQKINFKYGCYLLETVNLSDERHLIFINGYYVNSACNLAPDVILKLYLPYKILDLSNHYKIVINVCKFECVPIVS